MGGPAKLVLIFSAGGTIALFYLFICCTITGMLVWIGTTLLITVVLARIGLANLTIKYVQRDMQLLGLLTRCLWLSRGTDFRLKLQPEQAPGIMRILQRLCGRLQIPLPDAVFLEMNAGAWVELKGLQHNLGSTHIGLGYDLLAGLNEQEIEAVLAHELAHAKLIHRAVRNWLGTGLSRAATVANQLSATADSYRKAGEPYDIAELILGVADRLTRWSSRLVSAYSRQDEFEADQEAAKLVGSASLRSSLQRLDVLQGVLARLPWNERVAQSQTADGLSRWLVRELAEKAADSPPSAMPFIANPYSTHPSTHDRLAALPDDGSLPQAGANGISLLAEPDRVARMLVMEIERKLLEVEREDLKILSSWRRKLRRRAPLRRWEWPGFSCMLGGIVIGPTSLIALHWPSSLLLTLGLLGLGWLLFRAARHRDQRRLPRPDFAQFEAARKNRPEFRNTEAAQKQIERDLRKQISVDTRKDRQAEVLAAETFQALARCDYVRAHVAARLCRELKPRSVEGLIGLSITSSFFQQEAQSTVWLDGVLRQTTLRSPATCWGAAWCLFLSGAWMQAEALLHDAIKTDPDDPTLLGLLALCQSNRGKLLSALASIRQTCRPNPPEPEHAKVLIRLLIDHGDLREAGIRLRELDPKMRTDHEVQFSWIRLHLLQREMTEAENWIGEMERRKIPGDQLVSIGTLYESARADGKATEFYERALASGHYPEASLALARHAAMARDKSKARQRILVSLDTTKLLGANARTPYQTFPQALTQLLALETSSADCQAWIATTPAERDIGPLANRKLMVYARNETEAATSLQTILQAMEPNKAPVATSLLRIKLAPRDLQPLHPVKPGVQYIYK